LLFDGDQVYHDCLTGEVVPDFQVYTGGPLSTFVRDLRTASPSRPRIVLSTSKSHKHMGRCSSAPGAAGSTSRCASCSAIRTAWT